MALLPHCTLHSPSEISLYSRKPWGLCQREIEPSIIRGHLKGCPETPASDQMVFIGSEAPAPLLPPSCRPRRLGSLAEQMWLFSILRIKITNYPQKQGHSEPGLQQQHLTGAQRKWHFPLPVQLTNIYSGPVIYLASCFSLGFLCQGCSLILEFSLRLPASRTAGSQSCVEDPVSGGPGPHVLTGLKSQLCQSGSCVTRLSYLTSLCLYVIL